MNRYLAPLVAVAGLVAIPAAASATTTCAPGQAPGVAPLYCIPAAITPSEAAHATSGSAASLLSRLRPSALGRKGHVALPGTAAGPGTLKIVLTAKIHGKIVVLGSGVVTAGNAGATTVEVTLTKAGKRALKSHKGKLTITVTTTFAPTGGAATTASGKAVLK